MSKLVDNERVKLMATFFNNLGVAAFATGIIIPLVNLSAADTSKGYTVYLTFALGVGIGLALHWFANHLLGTLKE